MKIGYARASTIDQHLYMQKDTLNYGQLAYLGLLDDFYLLSPKVVSSAGFLSVSTRFKWSVFLLNHCRVL